jgi:sugar phosphate permease
MNIDLKKIAKGRWIHIIIPTILVYIAGYMDRANIGFAVAGGMDKALGLTATFAGLASGIFFIGYVALQIPGGVLAEQGKAKKFIAWTIVAWGGISILMGFVENTWQLLVLRFLLGVAEGGLYPAILAIISHWYPNEERGRANAYFMMNNAIASIIAGPIAGLLLTFSNWRGLFIAEGVLSLLLILIWLPLIDDRPDNAKWLNQEEKDYINNKIKQEQEALKKRLIQPQSLKTIIKEVNLWKLVLIYFCSQAGAYGFSLWLPTIVKSLTKMGIGSVSVLSSIPFIGLLFGYYIFSSLSDKTQNRKLYSAIPLICFAVCLVLSVIFKGNVIVSFAFLIGCGVFFTSATSVFWTMIPLLYTENVAGAARGLIGGMGNLGGFLGPFIVGLLITHGGMDLGLYGMALILFIGFLITLTLPAITTGKNGISINKPEQQIEVKS